MLARNSTSASFDASESLGWKSAKTLSWVSCVWRLLRSYSYSPDQKNVLPPGTCSMSSTLTPRARSTSTSASPKSSPTGPTTRTSVKKEAERAKCTAEPPSRQSRCPHGVLTASNAIDPTTVTVIAAAKGIRTPDVGTEATLPDGRVLSYLDLGHPTGTPVMALDGPGSRALGRAAMPAAAELGVRVIVPDRPGFLGSTPQPDRAIVDWVADATTLADALGIDAFGLLGQSAGTPVALAGAARAPGRWAGPPCARAVAARAPDRVLAVALCGAPVPPGDPGALDGVSGPMKPL